METPSGGGASQDGDPLVLLLKITWQAEAPPPLPLPPIQPSRAAAPVSYYKMAAKAPPSTGNPWTSHGENSFIVIISTLRVALRNPRATLCSSVSARWQTNQTSNLEVKRGGREGSWFFFSSSSSSSAVPSEAPLWHLCFWRGEEGACLGARRPETQPPARFTHFVVLRTWLSPGRATVSPPPLHGDLKTT